MRRGELRRRTTFTRLLHALPEANALLRIVSAAGHVHQPDLVGFAFMLSAERHEHAELRTGSECAHDRTLLLVIHVAERNRDAGERGLREALLKDTLRAVARSCMRHLV